jgi:hypothetical protein
MPAAIPQTQELKDRIAQHIADGHYMADFCGTDGIPDRSTVWRWMDADDAFATQCARARAESAELYEAKMAGLLDDTLTGAVPADASRAAQNALTWLAKVRGPERYGEKLSVQANVTGDLAAMLSDRKGNDRAAG